jgi:hypothetical protein
MDSGFDFLLYGALRVPASYFETLQYPCCTLVITSVGMPRRELWGHGGSAEKAPLVPIILCIVNFKKSVEFVCGKLSTHFPVNGWLRVFPLQAMGPITSKRLSSALPSEGKVHCKSCTWRFKLISPMQFLASNLHGLQGFF